MPQTRWQCLTSTGRRTTPFSILILLVGDHSGHKGGYRDIGDSVWIRPVARTPTETPRLVVIGVLPIGRPTPSALRADATRGPRLGSCHPGAIFDPV
jgi:hypothetical protein